MPRLRTLLVLLFLLSSTAIASAASAAADTPTVPDRWTKLPTEPYRGKQDDVFFLNADDGWYVNGDGKIFGTHDGGGSWKLLLHKPGTYFRSIAFLDAKRGFAGNIGTEYFPGVTDTTLLYATEDGGETWKPVEKLDAGAMRGICAIDVVTRPAINAGKPGARTTIHAGGRVGGPAVLLRSTDDGKSWRAIDLSKHCGMLLDVKFFDADNGVVCAASDADLARSHAEILTTSDGGKSWVKRYESTRPYELTWKCSFPTRDVGYVTIQSYDPDTSNSKRWFAKTADGGKTWSECLLADDAQLREFGVGFVTPERGWIGGAPTGYETRDGGKTWAPVEMGVAVNKIRVVPAKAGVIAFAIGLDLFRIDLPEIGSGQKAKK